MNGIILRKNLDFDDEVCRYLTNYVKNKNKNKFAVVFDIDDTLIYTNQKTNNKIKKMYDSAIRNNIPVFIVTARILNKSNINFTMSQLINHGFNKFQRLFLMPIKYLHQNSIGLYKFHVRQNLSKTHKIILNVGDQWTDLFPNPTSLHRLANDYYIFNNTSEGKLIKLKSLY